MDSKLTELSKIIAKYYRKYDEYPETHLDFDVYYEQAHGFFEELARQWITTTIPDAEQRAKALLKGMLVCTQSWVSNTDHASDEVVDLHFAKCGNEFIDIDKKVYAEFI